MIRLTGRSLDDCRVREGGRFDRKVRSGEYLDCLLHCDCGLWIRLEVHGDKGKELSAVDRIETDI